MAFLDNSGDIILDAVLTDTGRMRLARGDGSFKITKFALGDDEIDYESYDGNHPSGSAFYDLEILQTPVFEAFTNNTSTMKSKLISLTNNNLLYLPILKMNEVDLQAQPTTATGGATPTYGSGSHVLLVDADTIAGVKTGIGDSDIPKGTINGTVGTSGGNHIRVDQGLDTTEISPALTLDPELKETQYIVEIDSRFAKIYDKGGDNAAANPSFIDDDSIASYYFTANVGDYVTDSSPGATSGNNEDDTAIANKESIDGPRGTRLKFGLLAATDVVSSNYLFTTLGGTLSDASATYDYIDTTIRVMGVTTGYKIDIPLRILKKQ